jgi:hypothetical protein
VQPLESLWSDVPQIIVQLQLEGLLTSAERDVLLQELKGGRLVLEVAHESALVDEDMEYLVALLKDIGGKLLTRHGQRQLQRQETVLHVARAMCEQDMLSWEQLLYLQNLALVASETVLAPLRRYKVRDGGYRALILELQSIAESAEKDLRQSNSGSQRHLERVLIPLLRAGRLSQEEASMLRSMAGEENGVVSAALDLFQEDGNIAELADTLIRTAKIKGKRVTLSPPPPPPAPSVPQPEPIPPLPPSQADEQEEDEEEDEEEEEEEEEEEDQESGAEASFSELVMEAVREGAFSQITGIVLCDAFTHDGDHSLRMGDLVQGAWEAYTLTGDADDFKDTITRIARVVEQASTEYDRADEQEDGGDEEEEDEEGGDDEDDHETEALASPQRIRKLTVAIEKSVAQCVEVLRGSNRLSAIEGAYLLRPSERGRALIYAALEVYHASGSISDLLDTFVILARKEASDAALRVGSKEAASAANLHALVNALAEDEQLSSPQLSRVKGLIDQRDESVFGLHSAYEVDRNIEKLVQSIKMLVSTPSVDEKRKEEDAPTHTLVDRSQVVQLMEQTGVLSAQEAARVLADIDENSESPLAKAFDRYEATHDVSALVDNVLACLAASVDDVHEADAEFLFIVRDMQLSELETTALRVQIAKQDPIIRACLEVFRVDRDALSLTDTLRRVARQALNKLLEGNDEEENQGAAAVEIEDEQEVELAEEGIDLTRADRAPLFDILMTNLEKEGILENNEVERLSGWYASKDEGLFSALTQYFTQRDLQQLVIDMQTLLREAVS